MKKPGQVAGPVEMGEEQIILYKCRNCNRTDRKPYNPVGDEQCSHCNSPMDPLEIRYKCINCGTVNMYEVGRKLEGCKSCGYRIYAKPRKDGMAKVLKAE